MPASLPATPARSSEGVAFQNPFLQESPQEADFPATALAAAESPGVFGAALALRHDAMPWQPLMDQVPLSPSCNRHVTVRQPVMDQVPHCCCRAAPSTAIAAVGVDVAHTSLPPHCSLIAMWPMEPM